MKCSIIVTLLIIVCDVSLASRILFLFPSPSKSHLIVAQGLSTTLAQKGHDVTMISPFPLGNKIKNYRDIELPLSKEAEEMMKSMVTNPNQSMIRQFPTIIRVFRDMSVDLLELSEYKRLLRDEKFDLVVIGMFFNNFLMGVGDHFKCPTIMLSANQAFTTTNILVGNPFGVSSVPHMQAKNTGKMNFLERVKSFLLYGTDLAMNVYMDYEQRKIHEKYFPADRYVPYDKALKNISMVLLNSHFSQGTVRPYVPAMIEVGGIQIKPNPDPLPIELKQWLDEAKDGAIFFSFGTNAKTSFLPREKVEVILKVFSTLKQRVVMKWESDTLAGKPDNVMIGKWLPQDDILAHKNVKLFVSHCGLGSAVESKYHAVPIVGLPIFGDQEANSDVIVNEGWAVKVDFATMTEKSLLAGISEVLNNATYAKTVKKISELYRDRPQNARDTAVFWVEYVIRHHGAPHLQYPAVQLQIYQRMSLDVIGLLLLCGYILFKLSALIVKCIFKTLFQSSSKAEKAKKKKKN